MFVAWREQVVPTYAGPDSLEYIKMVNGDKTVHPFAARIGMPLVCRWLGGVIAFIWLSRAAIVASLVLFGLLMHRIGLSADRIGLAVVFFAMHVGLLKYLWRFPVLTDQVSGLIVVWAWYAAACGCFWSFCAAMVLGVLVREWNVPVCASLGVMFFAWLPVVSVSLLCCLIYWLVCRCVEIQEPDPTDIRCAPTMDRIRMFLPANWRQLLRVTATWGIVAPMAAVGAFDAPPEIAKSAGIILVCGIQGIWATDIFRFHLQAWPSVLALAVCV